MRFSIIELMALCYIGKMESIFGIHFPITSANFNEKQEEVIASLHQKNILDKNQLSEFGWIVLSLLKQYNQSKYHVFLNRGRFGKTNKYIISIVLDKDEVILTRRTSKDYVSALFESLTIPEDSSSNIANIEVLFTENGFNKYLDEQSKHMLVIKTFQEKVEQMDYVYAWNDETCYKFNMKTSIKAKIQYSKMQKEITNIFNINTV